MRNSTLFVVTWVIWITAKGRAKEYWKLATENAEERVLPSASSGASGSGNLPPLTPLPDIRERGQELLDYFGNK